MGISKTEINLRRLLAAAPQQQNQSKLIHYVATLREQLEQLAEERTPDGLPRVSKAMVNEYSEKIEAIASKLAAPLPDILVTEGTFASTKESSSADGETHFPSSPGLRRRIVGASNSDDRTRDIIQADTSAPVKLDTAAKAHIEKHRKLQEDLTDEMVGLAQQLKESSLLMSQSLQILKRYLILPRRLLSKAWLALVVPMFEP
ncbi:cation:cation antiporter, putative [Ricinus communis]|uniref:Cation:cation antiporter, putative n=1 Tax=Ricinus communis TaxID=3988 RepID=B9RZA5_RICCO|nr:cation:cation antiporter, putative [Ricinus communis]